MSARPRTAYARGAAFEREVKAVLEAVGCTVQRSAGSAGVYDLVAIKSVKRGEVLLIQCKKGGACPPAEWNRLWDLATAHGAVPIIAERPARGALRLWWLRSPKGPTRGRNPWIAWEIGGAR